MTTEEIRIEGMGCDHCVSAVRTALESLEGVEIETVEIGSARVRVDRSITSESEVDQAIRDSGYEPVSHATVTD